MSDQSQYILFLSKTYEGTIHDKKICDIEEYQFPENFLLRYDLGYIGYYPANTMVEVPHKNTKLNPLTQEQKLENQNISRKRVVVEQSISGVKRLRIVKDTIRTYSRTFRNEVMRIACGLHNFRVVSHARAYAPMHVRINFYP